MRRLLIAALLCLIALAGATVAHAAARQGAWKGQATSVDRSFKYGKVTFRVKGSTIHNLKIESVTVSGCGGLKSIVVPKLKIKGKRFTGAYQPVAGVDDIISVNGRISGGTAKGTFSEGPLCQGAGRFTARAR
jgi:hypothetical protein